MYWINCGTNFDWLHRLFLLTGKFVRFSQDAVNDPSKEREKKSASQTSTSSDKFAPRFDGLRFIETLVTAHR